MTHLLAIVIGIGLVDAVNPSTVAPALYLAGGPRGVSALTGFVSGVFVTNLAAGVVLALGPGQAILAAAPHPGQHARHVVEAAAGAATIILAGVLWLSRERVAGHVLAGARRFDRSALVVGVGIVLVELPTAIPYFAVIATVVGSGHSAATQVTLLAIFNLCFVLPVLVILAFRAAAGERALGFLARARDRIDHLLAVLAPALVALVGVALLAVGLVGLLA